MAEALEGKVNVNTFVAETSGGCVTLRTAANVARFSVPEPCEKDTMTECVVCEKKDETKKCSRCKSVFYCSAACQRQDWTFHKTTCCNVDVKEMTGRKFVKISMRAALAGKKCGRFGQEVRMFKHLIRLAPDQPMSYANVASALVRVGEFDDAAAFAGKHLEPVVGLITRGGLSSILGRVGRCARAAASIFRTRF
jgi:hypothetical protein